MTYCPTDTSAKGKSRFFSLSNEETEITCNYFLPVLVHHEKTL